MRKTSDVKRRSGAKHRIDTPEASIVFAGDQTAKDPGFVSFASGADLLVLHAIVNRSAEGTPLANVVALPRDLGRLSTNTNAKRVVLSHLMEAPAGTSEAEVWSLADLDSITSDIRKEYSGPVDLAADMSCFPVSP